MPESETDRPSPPEQAESDVATADGGSEPDPKEAAAAPECEKCGSMLPGGEEGICAVCGTAFGFQTSQMERITPELLAELGLEPPVAQRPKQSGTPAAPPKTAQPAPNVRRLAMIVGCVVVVLIGILFVLLATRG